MLDWSYLLLIFPMAVALVLGLLVPILVNQLYRSFGFGSAYIAVAFLIDPITMGEGGFHLGINLYLADILLVPLALAAGLRLVLAHDCPKRNRAWLLFCVLFSVSLCTGLLTYGAGAGVQARSYFYFVAAGLYGMCFDLSERRVQFVLNTLVAIALFLFGLACYRWVVYFTPITSLLPPEGAYNIDGPIRVIYSSSALVLAQVLIGALFFPAASRGFGIARHLAPLLLGAVLALQHRSVWLASLAGVATRVFIGNVRRGYKYRQLLYVIAMAAITATPLAFSDKVVGVWQQIETGASSALAGDGSVNERLQSWKAIIDKWHAAGPMAIAIGQSFGTDNARLVTDEHGASKKISYYAHNLYVQTLFNTGLLGLSALLAAFGYVTFGLYRICRSAHTGPVPEALLVLMVMQLTYYMAYGEDTLQSFIFGIALAYVVGKQKAFDKKSAPYTGAGQLS